MQHVAGQGYFFSASHLSATLGATLAAPALPPDALAGAPTAAGLVELGLRLKAAGDWRAAADRFHEALRMDPNLSAAQYNLGVLYLAAGDLARALEHTERAYHLDPRSADAMNNLGSICRTQGHFDAAVQWYRAAAHVAPNCEVATSNLAVTLVSLGLSLKATDPKRAIKCYQESLVLSPANANAYYNLGVSYAEQQKYSKALINYQLAVHFEPRCAEAYNNMGVIYKEQENMEKALKYYHMALQCNPRFAQALNNLGVACTTTGRLQEALEYLTRAVAAAPTYAEAYNNLGWLFWDHGDLGQALRMYERCIELSPASKNPSQNRLLALNYLHGVAPDVVYEAHRAWAERFTADLGPVFTEWPVSRTVNRRLRVGYISPDFFHHSVSFFCHAIFEHRNQEQFEIFLYSNTSREDDKTALFKSMVSEDRWRKVTGRPAQEVAQLIRDDRIDILVELAGHTANNRLDVVALKPAPVQITYIGYNNTTGLGAIDYRITDAIVDPPDSAQPFSEELVRIPGCFLCYTPPARVPDVEQLPALRNGFVTFGSFSCLAKICAPCVALWARVLHEVPNSRLLVKNKGFYSLDVQQSFIKQFKAHGIAEHRLKLMSLAQTSYDHLKVYNEVDVALDTFPYSNTTTNCETLLMGVPVVCLAGSTHGSRVGVTLLTSLGLSEFIAASREDYAQKAKGLAGNLQALSALRSSIRQLLLSSPLCDGPGFVRDKYEPVLLDKWRLFCEGRPPSVQAYASPELPGPLAPGPFAPPLAPGAPMIQPPANSVQPPVNSGHVASFTHAASAVVIPGAPLLAGALLGPPPEAVVPGAALTAGPALLLGPPPEAAQPPPQPLPQQVLTVGASLGGFTPQATVVQAPTRVVSAVCGAPASGGASGVAPGRRRPRVRTVGRRV